MELLLPTHPSVARATLSAPVAPRQSPARHLPPPRRSRTARRVTLASCLARGPRRLRSGNGGRDLRQAWPVSKRVTLSPSTTNFQVVRIAPQVEFAYVTISERPSSDSDST